jgi:hypothetical protein
MRRAATVIILTLGAVALDLAATSPGYAQFPSDEVSAPPPRRPPPRARTRITVSPAYPYRPYSTTFPVPYQAEYPGPGAVRQCTSWLATEYRPSGTVLTPQMRCWWQTGR